MGDLNAKEKPYQLIYQYSKGYIPFKLFTKLGLKNLSPQKMSKVLTTLGLNVSFVAVAYFLITLLQSSTDKSLLYIAYFAMVVISSVLGGLNCALLTTALIFLETYLLGNFSQTVDLSLYIQLTFFVAGAISISYLIELIRRSGEIEGLKERERRYAETFVQLHDQSAQASKAIKSRDEFLSIVSHELKTPLTVMLLNLHSMLNSIKSNSLAEFSIPALMKVLKNSEQQIKWLTAMINDLEDISLITTGRMSLQLEETSLVDIAKEVEQSFSELLKREKYKLKIISKSAVYGRWDKGRIKQVITNILSNAIKYGGGKPIEIEILKSGDQAKLIIRDQGAGIKPEDQKIIFELFKRAKQEKYKKGLGVGLFITSQIIKIHGGEIKVSSTEKGTTFTIQLPLK